MKRMVVLGMLIASGAFSLALAAYQQPAAPMVVEVEKLKDNLYVMKGGGGNSAVFIGADGVTVVDTKNPGWGKPLLEKIQSVTSKPVVRIINTHTHGDHVSGNVDFPATVDVVVQENTKASMENMKPVTGLAAPPPGPSIFQQNNGRGLAKRSFKDTLTIGSGADQIDLYYFGRAHTGGDAFVVFRALRVAHAGDAFHTRDLPIMDKNNGGSGVEYSATLLKAFNGMKNIDMVINGHNATTTTMADLKTQSEFIAEFVAFAQAAKKSGKTVDDVVATWKTPAKYTGYAAPQAARVKSDAQVIFDETK
ncbi:MAG TPA: MBL fold metallo-hydrolase [Vicinamibacterales bacterium]|nr:MBL fold metallo-hydrolase [Vicinamibacterales bacterium]